jgi:hypothetical protein
MQGVRVPPALLSPDHIRGPRETAFPELRLDDRMRAEEARRLDPLQNATPYSKTVECMRQAKYPIDELKFLSTHAPGRKIGDMFDGSKTT